MEYIISLDQVSKNDIKTVGGKAANIGEIIKMHIPVPTGVVVTTAAFDRQIQLYNLEQKIDQTLRIIDPDDTERLSQVSALRKQH